MNPIHTLINDTLALDEKAKTVPPRSLLGELLAIQMASTAATLARIAKIAVEALEDAPHDAVCSLGVRFIHTVGSVEIPCDCWKSRALAAIEREAGK